MIVIAFVLASILSGIICFTAGFQIAKKQTVSFSVNRQWLLHDSVAMIRAVLYPIDRTDSLSPESRKQAEEIIQRYTKEVKAQ